VGRPITREGKSRNVVRRGKGGTQRNCPRPQTLTGRVEAHVEGGPQKGFSASKTKKTEGKNSCRSLTKSTSRGTSNSINRKSPEKTQKKQIKIASRFKKATSSSYGGLQQKPFVYYEEPEQRPTQIANSKSASTRNPMRHLFGGKKTPL